MKSVREFEFREAHNFIKKGEKMKRIMGIAIIGLFVVTMLLAGTACKQEIAKATTAETAAAETTAAKTTTAETSAAEPITIVYMAKWNEGEELQKIINDALDQYMADNPNVTIEKIWGGREVNAALMASIQAGNPPDIYDEDPQIVNYSLGKEGLAVELSDYIANEKVFNEDITIAEAFIPGITDAWKYEGNLYALPTHQFVSVFWYDKTMFKELGISGTPSTWTEFLTLCETIKGKGVAPLVQDGGINFYNSYYYTYLADRIEGMEAFRNAVFDKTGAALDAPGFLEAAKKLEDIVKKGYFIKGYDGYQWPAGQIDWAQGAGAMMLNHTYLPIEVKDSLPDTFEFGAFPFPSVEGGKGNQYQLDSIIGAVAILKSSKYPDVCFDIAKRLLSKETQSRIMNEAWTLPVRTGIDLPEQFVDLEDIFSKQTGAFRAYAGGPGQIEPEWEQQVFYPLDDKLIFGKITADEFITQLKAKTVEFWAGK